MELNRLYHMDCMEGMKRFPDGYFELAVVDPPYGIDLKWNQLGKIGIRKDGSVRSNLDIDRISCVEYENKSWDKRPEPEYFEELSRVSKKQIIFGGNHFPLPPTGGWIVWNKKQTMPSLSKCELAWTSFLGHVEYFCHQWSGFLKGPESGKTKRIHPTQKPIGLYAWILEKFAKPGDKILYTHVGSSSSLIACHDAGHEYVGFELDADYHAAATKRIEEHKAQMSIMET